MNDSCVTNTQYLYDTIINSGTKVKATAVIAISRDDKADINVFVNHLVLEFDDNNLIDPSYDVFCLPNKYYFDNIKDVIDKFKVKDTKLKTICKELMGRHVQFIKLAEQINNGVRTIVNETYYHNQADYIKRQYDTMRI